MCEPLHNVMYTLNCHAPSILFETLLLLPGIPLAAKYDHPLFSDSFYSSKYSNHNQQCHISTCVGFGQRQVYKTAQLLIQQLPHPDQPHHGRLWEGGGSGWVGWLQRTPQMVRVVV